MGLGLWWIVRVVFVLARIRLAYLCIYMKEYPRIKQGLGLELRLGPSIEIERTSVKTNV